MKQFKVTIECDGRKWTRTFPSMEAVNVYIKACREAYGSIRYIIEEA